MMDLKRENFLCGNKLKQNLIFWSLFISFFEFFKENIITKVKGLFITGMEKWEAITDNWYQTEVLVKKRKDVRISSLMWLQECNALNDKDIETLTNIRKNRNKLVHEFVFAIEEWIIENYEKDYQKLMKIYLKFNKWWITSIEEMGIPESNVYEWIESSSTIMFKAMYKIAMGNNKGYEKILNSLKSSI